MNFKKLFIGGLCVTAALASCTKELSVAPSAEGIDSAISLGEGLTITGTKGDFGVDTKSVWDWNGKNLGAYWSDGDQLGAAFYNYVSYDAAGKPQSNPFGRFMTNFYFDRTDTGVKTQAEFQSPTNMMAGAYVLYFPYNSEWTDVDNKIPVVVNYPQTMDIDAPFAHLSDNMFSCVSYAALEGGTDLSSKFQMKPVTNVLSLNFKVDNVKLMELAGKIDIAQVYIETAADVMFSEGYIPASPESVDYTKALADPREDYVNKTAVHQVLVNLNKTSDDYTISKTNTPTEEVHVSVLPYAKFSKNSGLYVKVVTSDGRVYSSSDLTATDGGLKYLNDYAMAKGTRIPMTITLTTEDTGEIYTEEEFKAQWNAAAAGTEDATLTVGTDLVVKDFPMTKDNEDVKITITNKNNATLTLEGDLTLEDGMLEVNLPLTVDGDFTFGNNANISGTGTLSVNGQTTIDGAAANTNITIVKMNDVAISRTGEFKINGKETTKVGNIVNRGKLTLANINIINSLENKADNGSVKFESDVVVTGTLDSYGATSGSFTNHGTVNLFASSSATIENAAADPAQGLKAGVINVKNAGVELNVKNNSNINIEKSATLEGENNGTVLLSAGINLQGAVTGNGTVDATAANSAKQITWGNTSSRFNAGDNTIVFNIYSDITNTKANETSATFVLSDKDNKELSKWNENYVKKIVVMVPYTLTGTDRTSPKIFHFGKDVELANGAVLSFEESTFDFGSGNAITVTGDAKITGAVVISLPNTKLLTVKKGGKLTFSGKDKDNKMSFNADGEITVEGSSSDVVFTSTTVDLKNPVKITQTVSNN